MMDISVLDEAEIDNSSAVDCADDYRSDSILDPDKDNMDMEMKELPEQLMESEVDHWGHISLFISCRRCACED